LYVSTNTIYVGNVPLTVDTATNTLLVNGSQVSGSGGSATTSTLVNNGYTLSVDDAGVVTFPAFIGSPSLVTIQSTSTGVDLNVTGRHWTFGADGGLTFPLGDGIFDRPGIDTGFNIRSNNASSPIYLYTYGTDGDGTGAGNIYINPTNVEIYSSWNNGGAGEKKWTFGLDGNLTLPRGLTFSAGAQIFEQSDNIGAGWATGLNIRGSGTAPTDPIRIYPYGQDGKGANMGAINIKSDSVEICGNIQNDTSGVRWIFARDGSLTLSNGAKLDGGTAYKFATDNSVTQYIDLRDTSGRGFYTDGSGYTLRTSSSHSWIFDPNGILNLPNSTTGAPLIQATNEIQLNADGSTFTFGSDGNLYVPNEIRSTAGVGPVTIEANDGTLRTWTFGGDGSLTAPGPIYGGSNSIGLVTPAPLNLNNTGPIGQSKTQLNLINTAGNGGTGSAIDYFTYVDQGNGLPGARLSAVDDDNYSANFSIALKGRGNAGNNGLTTVWQFGSDGNLTFPDGGSLRVSTPPTSSIGASGDKLDMVAFNGDYIYYCKQDYSAVLSTIVLTVNSIRGPAQNAAYTNNGGGYGTMVGFDGPLTGLASGQTFVYNTVTYTIQDVSNTSGEYAVIVFSPQMDAPTTAGITVGTQFSISTGLTQPDIWVRSAWTSTTW
jgi:hypothetical protein